MKDLSPRSQHCATNALTQDIKDIQIKAVEDAMAHCLCDKGAVNQIIARRFEEYVEKLRASE